MALLINQPQRVVMLSEEVARAILHQDLVAARVVPIACVARLGNRGIAGRPDFTYRPEVVALVNVVIGHRLRERTRGSFDHAGDAPERIRAEVLHGAQLHDTGCVFEP